MTGFSLVLILTAVQAIIDPTDVTPDHGGGLQLNWRTFGDEGRTIDGPEARRNTQIRPAIPGRPIRKKMRKRRSTGGSHPVSANLLRSFVCLLRNFSDIGRGRS